MAEKEQKQGKEKWGKWVIYGGLIAGVIGLALNPEIAIAGFGIAGLTGVVFEARRKNTQPKMQKA